LDLIKENIVSKEEIKTIIDKVYKPRICLMSYTLDQKEKSITIFTHAPNGIFEIEKVSKYFNTHYVDESANDLAHSIEKINLEFAKIVQRNEVLKNSADDTLLDKFVWTRAYQIIWRPKDLYRNAYEIYFSHGHDDRISDEKQVFNLDSYLGKSDNHYVDEYKVLYNHEEQLSTHCLESENANFLAKQNSPLIKIELIASQRGFYPHYERKLSYEKGDKITLLNSWIPWEENQCPIGMKVYNPNWQLIGKIEKKEDFDKITESNISGNE